MSMPVTKSYTHKAMEVHQKASCESSISCLSPIKTQIVFPRAAEAQNQSYQARTCMHKHTWGGCDTTCLFSTPD